MAQMSRRVKAQQGNIDKILMTVLGLAVAVAVVVYLYMEATHRALPDPALDYPDFTLLEDMTEAQFITWHGTLSCGPDGNWAAFSREISLQVSTAMVALEAGNVKGFLEVTRQGEEIPRELRQRFEFWRGRITGNQVTVQGWYTEGPNVVKRVSMSGGLTGEKLLLEGTRGPRRCRIEAVPAPMLEESLQ